MAENSAEKLKVASGVDQLDFILDCFTFGTGDLIHLTSEIPNAWSNLGPDPARLRRLLVK